MFWIWMEPRQGDVHNGDNRTEQEQMGQVIDLITWVRSKTLQLALESLVCDKLVQTKSLGVEVMEKA